jgi:hypothetical protein
MILLTGDNGFLGNYIKKYFIKNAILFQTTNRSKADYILDLTS